MKFCLISTTGSCEWAITSSWVEGRQNTKNMSCKTCFSCFSCFLLFSYLKNDRKFFRIFELFAQISRLQTAPVFMISLLLNTIRPTSPGTAENRKRFFQCFIGARMFFSKKQIFSLPENRQLRPAKTGHINEFLNSFFDMMQSATKFRTW